MSPCDEYLNMQPVVAANNRSPDGLQAKNVYPPPRNFCNRVASRFSTDHMLSDESLALPEAK